MRYVTPRGWAFALATAATFVSAPSAAGQIWTSAFTPGSGTFIAPQGCTPSAGTGYYWWDFNHAENQFTVSTTVAPQCPTGMSVGFDTSYVPFSGLYSLRTHVCPAPGGPNRCTVGATSLTLDSPPKLLSSSSLITAQDPHFPSAGVIPAMSSICYTFVDPTGREWSTPAGRTCQDATPLPTEPALCALNDGAALDVALGQLDRASISTSPLAGAAGNAKKTISITCAGDGGVTTSTTFDFVPVTINGFKVISTPKTGLGVAVFYKGQLVGPSPAAITEAFGSGYSTREFEFQAVRDLAVPLKDFPTGSFTASATMIITIQ